MSLGASVALMAAGGISAPPTGETVGLIAGGTARPPQRPKKERPPEPIPEPEPENPYSEEAVKARPDYVEGNSAIPAFQFLRDTWAKLVKAKASTTGLIPNQVLSQADVSPEQFGKSLGKLHYMTYIAEVDSYAYGVECTSEGFASAIKFYGEQSYHKSMAVLKRARKAWKVQCQQHKENLEVGATAVYEFVLKQAQLSITDFRTSLSPTPPHWTRAKILNKKTGMIDDIIVFGFNAVNIQHIATVYNLSQPGMTAAAIGRVIDNNDPEGAGRLKIRVPAFHDQTPDEHLPWAERDSALLRRDGQIKIFPVGEILNMVVTSAESKDGKLTVKMVYRDPVVEE